MNCELKEHHDCCKEWAVPVFFVAGIFLLSMIFPVKFWVLIALMGTPFGMLVVGTCVTTATGLIFRRKMQVLAWENDRPFNDGDDDTPDPYLFNPGPGATWGLRAFMPDVERYSFAKTPISWLFKQSKRKVGILLNDGTVSFPWFPVAWISEAAGGGTRIDVPEGWKITAHQAEVLQARREAIKNIPLQNRTEYQRDFMAFTDLICAKNAKIEVEPVLVEYSNSVESGHALANLVEVVEKMAGEMANKIDVGAIIDMQRILKELADWREKRPTRLGKHQKILLDHDKRISELEIAGGIKAPRRPINPSRKK